MITLTEKYATYLTPAQYQKVGIDSFALKLKSLLLRPEIDVLQNISLKKLFGVTGELAIDLRAINLWDDNITLKSPIDGKTLRISQTALVNYLNIVDADGFVLDRGSLNENYIPKAKAIIYTDDIAEQNIAAYLTNAIEGMVWVGNSFIDIKDNLYCNKYVVLAEKCLCDACESQFTLAYLHHLYLNTPLLCQRLLAGHNLSQLINA